MYRCTECKTMYEIKPQFCDCGNDVFEEVIVVNQNVQPQQRQSYQRQQPNNYRKMSEEDFETLEEKREKQISMIAISISVLIAILIFLFVGNRPNTVKQEAPAQKTINQNIPDISTIWNHYISEDKSNIQLGLPVLEINTIDPNLREYLISLGNKFSENWNRTGLEGEGTATIEFSIDRRGYIINQKLYKKSGNSAIDDSANLLLSTVTAVGVPPKEYRGERIRLSFSLFNDGSYKVFYP